MSYLANQIKAIELETQLATKGFAKKMLTQAFSPDIKGSAPTPIEDTSPEGLEDVLTKQLGILDGMFKRYSNALDLLLVNGMAAEIPEQVESLGNLVLKCQNQSVKTARAIADIKRPRQTTFIKRYVNQQLNQLVTDGKVKQLGESADGGQEVDFGATQKAITIDSEMEAVGTLDRSKNSRRKRNK